MAKPSLSISPKSAYRNAPVLVRLIYMLMLTAGALLLADSVAGGAVLHLFGGSAWWILLGAFLGYMTHDSGLLVLRGRPLGTTMGALFGLGMIAISVLLFVGVLGRSAIAVESTAVAVGLLGLAIIVLLYLPATRAYFAEAQRIRMGGSTKVDYLNVPDGAKPGSWDAIKATEDAPKG